MTKITSKKALSKKQCVYCGSRKKLTKDHIPPKCLFAKPLPENLITVPCCRKCNEAASKDDEYFRSVIVLRRGAGDHVDAQKVSDKVLRALQRPGAKGLIKSLLGEVREFWYLNEQGFYELGASYNVDLRRLDRVASRIIRGLFWKEFGECLPDDYEAWAYNASGIQYMNEHQLRTIEHVVSEGELSVVGNNVFVYWKSIAPEDKYSTVWILLFYESVAFLCFTLPKAVKLERSRVRKIN